MVWERECSPPLPHNARSYPNLPLPLQRRSEMASSFESDLCAIFPLIFLQMIKIAFIGWDHRKMVDVFDEITLDK